MLGISKSDVNQNNVCVKDTFNKALSSSNNIFTGLYLCYYL